MTISPPVKVCFISPLGYGLYNPASGYPFGGAEVQFFLLANALASDQDFQVTVLTTVRDTPGVERHGPVTVVKRQGRDRLARGSLRGYASAFLDMRRAMREIDADVYLHATAGVEVGAYALICRLLHRRFVYVVASSVDLCQPNGQVQGPLAGLFPLGLGLAHAIVCRSTEQLGWLRSRYGREGVLIRTGHRLAEPVPHEKTTVLWVGRMHPLKQPEMFLDLAERLPKERFVMVIMQDPPHEHLLSALRARAAVLPNVTMHENVPWNEMDGYFGRAKLLINTSTYEGFPNTFVQAAMHGTPIISWKVNPDGILACHGIGIAAAGSFDRLLTAVQELCASETTRVEWGRRALSYAREYHDVQRSAAELKALARSLAGRSSAAGG